MKQDSLFVPPQKEVIQLDEFSHADYFPAWLANSDADKYFQYLQRATPWTQPEIRIAGKLIKIPRLQAWYGDEGAVMEYSGKRFTPLTWTPRLTSLRQLLQNDTGEKFNSVLVNLYRNGKDSVSWHADDEKELGVNPIIASLSLGETRVFSLRNRSTGDTIKLTLQHGDLLVMRGQTQHRWQHALLKVTRDIGPRINLTFRRIQAPVLPSMVSR